MINHKELKSIIRELYSIVNKLEEMFPGRHFTPDGHMVGSLGECIVADAYNLKLEKASNAGFDARTNDGIEVEIKATQSNSVAFRSNPQHAIIIKINKDGTFDEIFNGPGSMIWEKIGHRPPYKNGQRTITLKSLSLLNEQIRPSDRIQKST